MNSLFRADLHCHSICSDGTDTPTQLLQLAKKLNLSGLSLTDHDTTKAYTQEFFKEAESLSLRIITGVEISTEFLGTPVHILGYNFDLENGDLQAFLELMQKRRETRNRLILEKLKEKNIDISEEELTSFAQNRTVGRPHIAQLMMQKGHVQSIKEAFDRYIREGAPCYAPGPKYSPTEAIQVIRKAKGKAILAHPHFYKKGSFIKALLNLPFDGYECYYSKLDKSQERPWVERAQARGLLITGGSDYHGTIKPHIELGCSWVNERTFDQLSED